MPTPSLKEFAQAIPVCLQTADLAAVLDICRSSACDTLVVVSEQQRPLGIVSLGQVMPHLISWIGLGETPGTRKTIDFQKPLSQLELPIIEPLATLPAQMSLSQFWFHLQESEEQLKPDWVNLEEKDSKSTGAQAKFASGLRSAALAPPCPQTSSYCATTASHSQHWALVDEEGKFLGLLNSWRLLKFLAKNVIPTHGAEITEQAQPASFVQLVQLLEQLPLPLSLQTATGQVLSENLTWRQQIGTSPNLNWVRNTTAAMLDYPSVEPCSALITNGTVGECTRSVPDYSVNLSCEALAQQGKRSVSVALATQEELAEHNPSHLSSRAESPVATRNRLKQERELSTQVAVQRYCAIDTPCMAATVSQRQVILSAPPISKNDQAPTFGKVGTRSRVEASNPSQERVFSFTKIPLSPLGVKENGREGQKNWQTLPSDTGGLTNVVLNSQHPLTSNLWLVLAQDTTEQQKVTKELAAKNADLVQLNRLKDEFLACISHELKTPLTAVLGLSTLLKDQTLGPLNERQTRYARLIYQSGRQLMTVVNDILDLTRMETGQLELILEPVDIESVCDRAYAQVRQLQAEKDQEEDSTPETHFTVEIESGLENLVADELRLRQMLVHLLSNAIKFTNPGEEIGLKVNRWEGWIAFTVWDTGIGIPPEKQHLIFQKFQQLEQPLTRRHDGTGLGLVLTQHLARLHGGDVSFISKAGSGSQFTILLPPCPPQERKGDENNTQSNIQPSQSSSNQANQSKPQNSSAKEHLASRNRLILVVETVPRYLESLTEQLKNLAYRVVIARSGTEAIEKARTLQPYAILLNPLLPKLSGWDVLTVLKSDAETRHIPVLVTATQAEKQQAYYNKANGFLSLPVQEHALLKSLTNLTEQSCPPSRGLTILHLKPELDETSFGSSTLDYELSDIVNLQHSELNCRILEADDLDQADLLARVWHPDVVLLDGSGLSDPLTYLKEFSLYPGLTALPLVTLDHQTTEAANQVVALSVYPCLVTDHSSRVPALLQVIQVAAGISGKPSILIMDMGELEGKSREILQAESQPSLSHIPASPDQAREEQRGKSQIATSSTSHSSWLQALTHYLQTAGFRSVLSCSWTEVYRQLQDQSIDLLLIRLRDIGDSSVLVKELFALAQMPNRPPILVVDYRVKADSLSGATPEELAEELLLEEAMIHSDESTDGLNLLLKNVATQILRGPSQSMSQLLDQIYKTLAVNS